MLLQIQNDHSSPTFIAKCSNAATSTHPPNYNIIS